MSRGLFVTCRLFMMAICFYIYVSDLSFEYMGYVIIVIIGWDPAPGTGWRGAEHSPLWTVDRVSQSISSPSFHNPILTKQTQAWNYQNGFRSSCDKLYTTKFDSHQFSKVTYSNKDLLNFRTSKTVSQVEQVVGGPRAQASNVQSIHLIPCCRLT